MNNFTLLLNQARRLFNEGKVIEAEQIYARVIADAPRAAEALHDLGVIRYYQRRNDEALALINESLSAAPGQRDALINRGNILRAVGRLGDTLDSYRQALEIDPFCAEAFYNQGIALSESGCLEDALVSYGKALQLEPEFAAVILNNRGNTLWKLRRFEESLAAFDQALSIYPGYVDALINRGVVYRDMQRHSEALADMDHAIAIDKSSAEAWYNRGNILNDLQRLPEARDSYVQALIRNPTHRHAPSQVANLTVRLCDWLRVPRMREILNSHVGEGPSIVTPFALLALEDDPLLQKECAVAYVRRHIPPQPRPLWAGRPYRHDKIRIAYLSADFRTHATASLIAGLIEEHDRSRFEIFGISFGPDDGGPMRRRISKAFDHFHDVRELNDKAIAELLRDLEIDIAIDLHGHTHGSRPHILSYRPAPVQVSYLGYPGTMGADFIDYIIADPIVLPPDQRECFTERVAYLHTCYQANDYERTIDPCRPSRRDAGLPDEGFVFCCFNSNWKITPAIFDVWMRLLLAVPGSVLWLMQDHAMASANLRAEAEKRGVAANRLVFAQRTDPASHLARFGLADLFVDTLPVNAHTTASDALWAGVPLVTCSGRSFSGRVAASILDAVGLPELVAGNLVDYEAIALNLSTDQKALEQLREKLWRQRLEMPLFDVERIRQSIEEAYVRMLKIAENGDAPQHFSV